MFGLYFSLKSYHTREPSFKTAVVQRGDTGKGKGLLQRYFTCYACAVAWKKISLLREGKAECNGMLLVVILIKRQKVKLSLCLTN
jgi:hypothetical protein